MRKDLFIKTTLFLCVFFLIGIKVFSGSIFSLILSFSLFTIPFIYFFVGMKIKVIRTKEILILYALFLMTIIALFRQFLNQDISVVGFINSFLILLSVYFIVYVGVTNSNFTLLNGIRFLRDTLGIYIIINLVLYILGFTRINEFVDSDLGTNELLGYFGIQIKRTLFVLAPNLAYFAMTSGVFTIISLYYFKIEGKLINLLFVSIGTVSLFLTDARGPLIALIIFIFIILFFRRIFLRTHIALTFFLVTTVFFYGGIIEFISSYYDVESLSRENASLLSNREVIWEIFFKKYDPTFIDFFFGYGNVGQLTSGVSKSYSFLFSRWDNALQISLHNSSLQTLIDTGFLGLLIWTFTIVLVNKKVIRAYFNSRDNYLIIVPVVLNYILLTGITDIVLNISNGIVYFVILFLVILSLSKVPNKLIP